MCSRLGAVSRKLLPLDVDAQELGQSMEVLQGTTKCGSHDHQQWTRVPIYHWVPYERFAYGNGTGRQGEEGLRGAVGVEQSLWCGFATALHKLVPRRADQCRRCPISQIHLYHIAVILADAHQAAISSFYGLFSNMYRFVVCYSWICLVQKHKIKMTGNYTFEITTMLNIHVIDARMIGSVPNNPNFRPIGLIVISKVRYLDFFSFTFV